MNALMVINLVVNGLLTIVVAWVASKTRKFETLEAKLDAKAEQLVDARMAIKTGDLRIMMEGITAEVRQINRRLEKGDAEFDGLGNARHKLELQTQRMISDLKEYLVTQTATKAELATLTGRVNDMQIAMASDAAVRNVARKAS